MWSNSFWYDNYFIESKDAVEVSFIDKGLGNAGPVTLKYQDEDGNELASSETLNGKVGLPYESTAKSIDGWVLKETPANANGTFTEEAQEVVYVYTKTKPTKLTENSTGSKSDTIKDKGRILPQTGEQALAWVSSLGLTLLSVVGYVFYKKRK